MRASWLIALLFASAAAAQIRPIPADAQRAEMRHVEGGEVELDGKRALLAPGAQIRDESNRIVMPSALPAGSLVKYRLDASGQVRDVWILSPQEAAESP
jgi:hypothetical protein